MSDNEFDEVMDVVGCLTCQVRGPSDNLTNEDLSLSPMTGHITSS